MTFSALLTLPGHLSPIRVKQLYFKDYLNLQKYIHNNDNAELEYIIDEIIKEYTDLHITDLSAVDKFCILLFQKSISQNHSVKFMTENKVVVDFNINSLIESIIQIDSQYLKAYISNNLLGVDIRLPRKFCYAQDIDFYYSCIRCLTVNGHEQPMLQNLEKLLPATLFSDILKFVNAYEEKFNDISLKLPSDLFPEAVKLKLRTHDLIEILKFVLKENLTEVYEKIYTLVTKKGLSYVDLNLFTPGEVDIMMAHTKAEAEKNQTKDSPIQNIAGVVKQMTQS